MSRFNVHRQSDSKRHTILSVRDLPDTRAYRRELGLKTRTSAVFEPQARNCEANDQASGQGKGRRRRGCGQLQQMPPNLSRQSFHLRRPGSGGTGSGSKVFQHWRVQREGDFQVVSEPS